MPILRFHNSRLPKDSRDYTVEIPAHQNIDAAVQSLADSGWGLALAEREDENTADGKSAGTKTRKAQPAPSTHEGN